MRDEAETKEIIRRLAEKMPQVVAALGLKGRRVGREWICARRAAGGLGDSCQIRLAPPNAGVWAHHSAGKAGDALDLIEYVQGCSKGAAFKWARQFLGIEEGRPAAAPVPASPASSARDESEEDKRRRALKIWEGADRRLAGTLAEKYLAGRGLELPSSPALRFHPRLRHPMGAKHDRFPALVAAVCNAERKINGVWRIYLERDGSGKLKAFENAKFGLGPVKGCYVPLTPRAPTVYLTEGIETGLAVAQTWKVCVAAALSTSGLLGIVLPADVAGVVICGDWDAPDTRAELEFRRGDGTVHRRPNPMFGKRPGLEAAERAAARLRKEGRRVSLVFPGGPDGTDFNDLIRR